MLSGMGRTQQTAIASFLGAAGFGGLMWVGSQPNFAFPDWVVYGAGVISAGLALLSLVMFARVVLSWLSSSSAYGTIHISSEFRSSYQAPTDTMYLMSTFATSASEMVGGLAKMHNLRQPQATYDYSGQRFRITSYCSSALTDVRLKFAVNYHAKIAREDGSEQSGEVLFTHSYDIKIEKIDPGRDGAFEFFAVNHSDKFVHVTMPSVATGIPLEDSQPKELEIRHDLPRGVWVQTRPAPALVSA